MHDVFKNDTKIKTTIQSKILTNFTIVLAFLLKWQSSSTSSPHPSPPPPPITSSSKLAVETE